VTDRFNIGSLGPGAVTDQGFRAGAQPQRPGRTQPAEDGIVRQDAEQGLDSATVVALMSRHSSLPINTFSVGFTGKSYDELPHARVVAKAFNTNHHELTVVDGVAALRHVFSGRIRPVARSPAWK